MDSAEGRPCEILGRGLQLVGDTHDHPTHQKTGFDPTEAIEFYESHGYDFVVFTDHRRLIKDASSHSTPGLTVVPGMELNGPDDLVGEYHILAMGLKDLLETPEGWTAQQAIDEIHADGGLAFMAHPFWLDHTPEQLLRLRDLDGLEIYNHAQHIKLGKGLSVQLWHQLLMEDRMLLATAGTDAHFPGNYRGLVGGSRIVVEATDRSVASIMAALRGGHFYSSTGPTIESCKIEGAEIKVRCSPAAWINVIANRNWGTGFIAEPGEQVSDAAYVLGSRRGHEKFVRVEVHDGRGGVAWTNPIFLKEYYATRES